MKTYQPIDATIAITYRCNSRCQMCNIWQDQNPAELPLGYFRNLAPTLKHINLTGGEPFLRPDLPEIVAIIKEVSPKAQIIISSNGLATELIREQINKILAVDPQVGVRISIDGLAPVHDRIRGIPGIFDHAISTIKMLKESGVSNLGLSFTIMDDNAGELPKVYDLSCELGIEMALALVQNSDIYFQKDSNRVTALEAVERDLTYLIRKELKSWRIKRWLRAFYDYGLLLYARKQQRLLPTGAGKDSLFIEPNGTIYPSNLISQKLGNLGEGKLATTWFSAAADQARQEMEVKNTSESWIICTIRGEMRRHLPSVGWWIIKHKFFRASL
ncbi:radical SAM protein [Candidatus Falkowbacteria bacterium]|nr:radical SAM protein [Candidatus Falkowbacteria bacterium]